MRRRYCNKLTPISTLRTQVTVSALIDSSLTKPRSSLIGPAAERQMADDMRQAAHREGGITDRDLELLGWTTGQVKELAGAANIRAQRLAGMTA